MLSSFATILCTSLLAGVAIAQAPNANFTQDQISRTLRETPQTELSSWCTGQHNSCGILCNGNTVPGQNTCTISQAALNYTCTCAANNSAPALQFYEPTITSFICNVVLGDCLKDHVSDQASQDNCKKTIVCGSSNVTTFQASAAPSAAATTSGASPSGTGSSSETSGTASTSTPSASPTSGAIALNFGQQYGVGVLSAGLLAIMGLAL